jgi:hypothetical protein
MKINNIKSLLFVSTILTAAVLMTGCASTGYQQADKTGAGLAEFRDEIVNAQKTINDTMKSLDLVASSATTDPRKAFDQFSKDVAKLDASAKKVAKRSQDMQVAGETYFKTWETQMAEMQNPDTRKLAETRKAKLQAAFAEIRKLSTPLKAQFDSWMSDLKDLEKYLSNDLTIAGVDAAKKLFVKAQGEGAEVQKSMDALVAELNTVAAAITPAKVEPAKK